jgi:Zn-dependent M28 family amino/carboxypeptidase
MFASGTIHRSAKFQNALDRGAAGFLIAGPVPGQVVAGSTGRGEVAPIPAVGISIETANALSRGVDGFASVEIINETSYSAETSQNLVFEMPGQNDEWIVLSAHIDGHDLAESAIDNASGLAVALSIVRDLSSTMGSMRRGLRAAFFNVEEWGLTGSAHYINNLTEGQRDSIALNINLDSVAGGSRLTAMTSGFPGLEPFLLHQSKTAGIPLGIFRPLQMNSDHGNFARAGIPAFRLVAGFNDPNASTRFVLTPNDRRDKVELNELTTAARLSKAIAIAALNASPADVAGWRPR